MRRAFHGFLVAVGLTALSLPAHALVARPTPLRDMAAVAERIFRGECLSARVGEVRIAGARIPTTTYTFRVSEYLKGRGSGTLTFQQVGTPAGGPFDLGQVAGLPVYEVGVSYVLFLLPESRARLTSPSGAGEGAMRIGPDERLRPAPHDGAIERLTYPQLRDRVLEAVGR